MKKAEKKGLMAVPSKMLMRGVGDGKRLLGLFEGRKG
jgi:hypothetical protein